MNHHPKAWLIWFAALVLIALVSRNPVYALILLLIAILAEKAQTSKAAGLKLPLGRLVVVILFFSTIYSVFFIHVGDHVLFSLPDWPLVGGAVTLEAAIDGVRNGFLLLTILTIFVAFNAIIPVSELVRLIPASLKDVGVVILVAVTYIPETRSQLARIQEAQAIRGHQLRGLRDWQPVVVPLLVAGFERSLRLSETMVARGYGSAVHESFSSSRRVIFLICLVAAAGGWILLSVGMLIGWFFVLAAAAAVIGITLFDGRHVKRSKYRIYSWSRHDWLMVITVLIALIAFFLPLPFIDRSSLYYSPYQGTLTPTVDIYLATALILLASPVILNHASGLNFDEDD